MGPVNSYDKVYSKNLNILSMSTFELIKCLFGGLRDKKTRVAA